MTNESIWALLVGVNHYQDESIRDLNGCENDVQAIRSLLERIGTPPTHIRTLMNEQATYGQVKHAFREHFITNPSLPADAQCIYYFSGHGSQIYDPDNLTSNGIQSTVLHDSRTGNTPDLLDIELGSMIRELYAIKHAYITVILDCCHSGSGTRDPQITSSQERTIPATNQDAHVRRIVQTLGGPQEPAPHVLMAACLDRQSSIETRLPTPNGDQVQRGVFSYYLGATFDQAYGRSYREWLDLTKATLQQFGYSQVPVCEGIHTNRSLFGTENLVVPQLMRVTEVYDLSIKVDAGLASGIQQGTKLTLYSDEKMVTSLTSAVIETVLPLESWARLDNSVVVPIGAFAIISAYPQIAPTLRLRLSAEPDTAAQTATNTLHERLTTTIATQKLPWIHLVADDQPCDAILHANAGHFTLYRSDGEPEQINAVVETYGYDPTLLELVVTKMVKARLVAQMHGPDVLGSQFAVEFRATQLTSRHIFQHNELYHQYSPHNGEQNKYTIRVTNNSRRDVHLCLVLINPDFSIRLLYPSLEEGSDTLETGKTFDLNAQYGRRLTISLPNGWQQLRDHLKVIITEKPLASLGWIEQDGLLDTRRSTNRSEDELWNDFKQYYDRTRMGGGDRDVIWTTKDVFFNVVAHL